MCKSTLVKGDKDTLLYSRFGGVPIVDITDNLEKYFYQGGILPESYSEDFLNGFLKALFELQRNVRELNEHGFYHNDIQYENILYDDTTKKLYLIDFEYLTDKASSKQRDAKVMKSMVDELIKQITKFSLKMVENAIAENARADEKTAAVEGGRPTTRRKPKRRKPTTKRRKPTTKQYNKNKIKKMYCRK